MPSINATTDQLGTYHIADHPELYTPSRNNNFVFMPIFNDDQTQLIKSGVDKDTAEEGDYITKENLQEILMLSVTSSSVPHYEQNVIDVKRGNGTIKFAGAVTYPSGTLKFNDYIGADTKSCLLAWRRLSFNQEDETIGEAKDYKIKGTLVEYTPDHKQIRYWDLYGCWISKLDEGEFSSEDDGKRQITATLQYDRAVEHLADDLVQVETTETQA